MAVERRLRVMGWGWGRVEIRDTQPSGPRPRPLAEDAVNICSGALEKKLIATVNVRRGANTSQKVS